LVDGELNDAERRELLLRLERSPDGWRWCAAAFLEAQAWRGEAKALVTAAAVSAGAPGLQPASLAAARPSGRASARIWMPAALAAGLLVATTWVFWNGNPNLPIPGAGSQAGNPSPSAPAQFAGNPAAGHDVNPADPAIPQNLQLVVNGGPEGRRNVEVPLVDAAGMDEALFGQWSQALPPEVIRMLEQNGHQVVRERRLVPFHLNDGRRGVVPMDQLEIRPVNMQTFQ
jgi:hypothetical protein